MKEEIFMIWRSLGCAFCFGAEGDSAMTFEKIPIISIG